MANTPSISAAEWEVMKTLWSQYPLTSQEIIDQLSEPMEWSPKTVKTLLNRLLKKGAIQFKAEGRTYYYSPLVTENDCIRAERKTFLQRIYGGALSPMLAHFIQDEQLTEEEIDELKKLLEEKR